MPTINPIIPQTEYKTSGDPLVDFDTSAGRTPRIIQREVTLQFPALPPLPGDTPPDAETPSLATVTQTFGGVVFCLVLRDADTLTALLGMGWTEAGE